MKKSPHKNVLLLGQTGSGKSKFIHDRIAECIKHNNKLVLIDPKRVEFREYKNSANLSFPVAEKDEDTEKALLWVKNEIDNRKKNINKNIPEIFVAVDEFSGFICYHREFFEEMISYITTEGKKVGINCVIATSKRMPEVVTDKIKNSFEEIIYLENR